MEKKLQDREWIIGDVFTTTFWGVTEVCIVRIINNDRVAFLRMEAVRDFETLKKDYCLAGMERNLFNRIKKTFLHHSTWHSEYKIVACR